MLRHVLIVLLMPILVSSCAANDARKSSVPVRSSHVTAIHPSSYAQAYHHFYDLAVEGDPVAQLNVGRMLIDGRGVDVDDKKAIKWFQKAAAQGNVDAKVSLGIAYLFAKGTERNTKQACKLFKQLWYKGDQEGQHFYKKYC